MSFARRVGHVRQVSAGRIEADGPFATVGEFCSIEADDGAAPMLAEVVAVGDERVVLMPLGYARAVAPDARVTAVGHSGSAPVGHGFAGRLVSALGAPLDGRGEIFADEHRPIEGCVLEPLMRKEPDHVLETGLRVIDGLLPLGRGQRTGVFAASGVGKTTLMRQLAVQTDADKVVVCLVGERGKEVEGFWRAIQSMGAPQRFSMVAATSDMSAVLRARSVLQALCLCEFWRDQGQDVLLVIDSVTRAAMAMREIGLAAGAPPTVRAYTPNVFAALPRIVERCGARRAGGAISAVMTVLAETDDLDDPIVEIMKSLLDGHIILSRTIAEQGRYPAVDAPRSISRQAERLITPAHAAAARRANAQLAAFEDARIMVESGLYKPGSNVGIDLALKTRDGLLAFLAQRPDERSRLDDTVRLLQQLMIEGRSNG
ncbi:MAG: FliI/YscN family ATPase [Hyphomonadaceae bacterium]|nr:FliI/YscN family ATPase [Hyphomonadaceae bacterium]